MNGKDLIIGLGYIGVQYFEEAETGTIAAPGRKRLRRPLLAAAIIALMLLLVGCAVVYALSVKDLHMGQVTRTQYELDENRQPMGQTEVVLDVISAQGVMGSPNFQASQEWMEFSENYELDLSAAEGFDIPAGYEIYGAFTQEMVDRVDEICAKYGLKPMGALARMQSYQFGVLYEALGFDSLFHGGVEMDGGAGWFAACGNFNVMFSFTLTDEEADWKQPIGATMRYVDKAYFDTISFSVGNIETVRQRNYTTTDGTSVLIVGEGNQTILLCDREDAFISLYFDAITLTGETLELSDRDIERICEAVDFTIRPQKPDMAEAERLLAEAETAYLEALHADEPKTVEELLATLDQNLHYAQVDMNSDGEEEVLVSEDGETLKYIYTKIGGGYVLYILWDPSEDIPVPTEAAMYLCADNSFEIYKRYENGSFFHAYYRLEQNVEKNGTSDAGYAFYNAEEGKWHRRWPDRIYDAATGSYLPYDSNYVITEEQAQAIIAAHPRAELELKPIRGFFAE